MTAAGTMGFGGYGFANALDMPGIRRQHLELPNLPLQWDGLRVLQISDVHAGPYMDVSRMTRLRDMAHHVNPDLIVFTGDQMDRRESDAELFVQGFSGISAPLGVWGILGNHDHFIDPAISEQALEAAGIQPLVNSAVTFDRAGGALALVGVEDLQARDGRGPDFSVLEKYPTCFRICLCHQPQGWHRAAEAGAHLTISGHTHGGQIALTARNLSVARLSTRYIAGPYRREESFLYVSRGVGVGAVPVRVGAPPEIDLLTLRTAAESYRVAA
ncbi:MAG: metallophosphoesterase [Acidobacteria bacterium]|nr:metallophosphoesterase [Acidobacteriota bacterium]